MKLSFGPTAFVVLVTSSCYLTSHAFVANTATKLSKSSKTLSNNYALPDPLMVDAGIAVVSAAAGAASQLPRIKQLERELSITKETLSSSEEEMVKKMTELEDRLFTMDAEYEAQTDRFKKQYDKNMQSQLEITKNKLKTDYEFKLSIGLEEQKSQMLKERYEFVNSLTGDKQAELFNLKLRQSEINKANEELEKALDASKEELDRLRSEVDKKNKKRFIFF